VILDKPEYVTIHLRGSPRCLNSPENQRYFVQVGVVYLHVKTLQVASTRVPGTNPDQYSAAVRGIQPEGWITHVLQPTRTDAKHAIDEAKTKCAAILRR